MVTSGRPGEPIHGYAKNYGRGVAKNAVFVSDILRFEAQGDRGDARA